MKPFTLEEFAQEMRRNGDIRQADMADEILMLLDLEEDVAEPYGNLCDDLNSAAPEGLKDKPEKQMEWVIDRSNLLQDIEKELDEDGRTGDTDDQVKALLETLGNIREIVGLEGGTDEDLEEAVRTLAERAARAPEEIEVMTYDL